MRNTAPCILYAALKIFHRNPDGIMLIAPSDHWIEKEEEFFRNIQTVFAACSENDILMTLGIQPDAPHTGYGYIQFESDVSEIKRVRNFTEKPDIETHSSFCLVETIYGMGNLCMVCAEYFKGISGITPRDV